MKEQNSNHAPPPQIDMHKERQELLNKEVNEIIKSRVQFINQNYPTVREAYQNHYNWPEMDTLRHEVCLCLVFGLHQAAITLTNHLLESLLKNALIVWHTKLEAKAQSSRTQHSIESFVALFRPARKQFSSNDLGDNINRACTAGLITKEQKKELHDIRERIRNPYSHSDKDKAFGDQRIPAQAVRIEDGKFVVEQPENPQLAGLIIAHGIAQAMQAEQEAVPYFFYMDKLVRQIRAKLYDSPNSDGGGASDPKGQ
jgi:hypothetical protein